MLVQKKKDEPAPSGGSGSGSTNKVINIKVIDRYRKQQGSTLINTDSLLPGAIVRLYKTEADMNNNISIGESTTNNSGDASISAGNAEGEYFVKAFHPKNSETAFQIVNFTPNAVTLFTDIRLPL